MNEFVTVYSAEIMRRLQSRIFWVGLMIGAIGLAAMIEFPSVMQSYANQTRQVVLAGPPAIVRAAKPLLAKDFTVVATTGPLVHPGLSLLGAHGNAAAVIELQKTPDGLSARVFAKDPGDVSASDLRRDLLPLGLELNAHLSLERIRRITRMPVSIHSLIAKFRTAAQSDTARITGVLLLSFLYVLLMINSQLVMSSVAEEKTSRIAELLVSSVSPNNLLAGKIASSTTLALLQMAVWVTIGFALGFHAGTGAAASFGNSDQARSFSLSGVAPSSIADFVIFFLLAYLQMVTIFAAAASLINRTEDLGSFSGPLFMPVIAAFFIAMTVMNVPDTPIAVITSFLPVISPFVMFARVVTSDVPAWQLALSIAINLASIGVITVLGGKIYRVGMLLYGRPPRLSQVWNVLRS